MDSYDKKHAMMADLIAMLKKHASDEVDSGLQKPEGEGDMHGIQVEKVEVLPEHEMDHPTPVHEVDTKMVPEHKASVLDESRDDGETPEPEETEEEAPSIFSSVFKKKKK